MVTIWIKEIDKGGDFLEFFVESYPPYQVGQLITIFNVTDDCCECAEHEILHIEHNLYLKKQYVLNKEEDSKPLLILKTRIVNEWQQ